MCILGTVLDVYVLVHIDFHLIVVQVISFFVELTLFSLEALWRFVIWFINASVHFDMQFHLSCYLFVARIKNE